MLELKFETEKGSEYYRDSESGLWKRCRHDGERVLDYVYVGSLRETSGLPEQDYEPVLQNKLIEGKLDGFEPYFKVGNYPLGFKNILPGDIYFLDGELCYHKELDIIPHIGSKITKKF